MAVQNAPLSGHIYRLADTLRAFAPGIKMSSLDLRGGPVSSDSLFDSYVGRCAVTLPFNPGQRREVGLIRSLVQLG